MEHAVALVKEKCKGCTTCIKQCPTEAIRVRRGRAIIIDKRCIDCGQCIRVCPHHAKKAVYDSMERLKDFEYNIALPAPSLYGQFQNLDNINQVLAGLLHIGFDHVHEVSRGAEIVSKLTRHEVTEHSLELPIISSACPAVVRLIRTRFPRLTGNISRYIAPMEIAAINARKEAMDKTGLRSDQIGIFFITPCPAKVTAIRAPGHLHKTVIDGAFAMTEVYKKLLGNMRRENQPDLSQSGMTGVGWALSGGESTALGMDNHLAVDGIENIIDVLEDIDDGKLRHIRFLELAACNQGCVGGCLTVENPYVAKSRIRQLIKNLPKSKSTSDLQDLQKETYLSDNSFAESSVWQLSDNRADAMRLFQQISELIELFPGLDCGACGTPCCRALAEDVVLGFASEDDCIFQMRERMQTFSETGNTDEYLPPPFRKGNEDIE